METKNREKLLLMGTGVVVALWLLDMLIVSPLIDSWHGRSAEIAKLKAGIANGASLVRRESYLRDRWDNMRANALANNAPVAERQLFTAFDHWVTTGGVTEGSFHPQVQKGDSNFTTVDCRSDVSGSLQNMRDFLRAMSRDPLADKVDSFELTSKDDNGRQLTLGLSLSGLILTDNDPSSVTLAPKPAEPTAPPDTNSAPTAEVDPFRLISRNNIFDQSRIDRGYNENPGPIRPVRRVETLTCHGSSLDNGSGYAWFSGSGVSESRAYKVGDSVDGLMISKITLNTVTVTNAGTNTFVLPTDPSQSLRREEDGPWRPSDYIAAVPTPDTNSTATAVSTPGSGSAADDIIARLKKKREQE
jgi:hypothetical protein